MNTVIGMILVLGVIILVHEWGHYIVARLFKVRVDVFSIGFGPRLFGFKRGDTDWRISALPLGGYVRMAGQDITDVDSGDQKPTGAPDELMSKPRWQRALISAAGPAVNLIFAFVILAVYYLVVGLPSNNVLSKPLVIAGLPADQVNNSSGLQVGDKVLSINGTKNPTWELGQIISLQAAQGSTLRLQVLRDGATREVDISSSTNPYVRTFGYSPIPPVIGEIALNTPADHAGLRDGDLVRSVDGQNIQYWDQFVDLVRNSGGKTLQLAVTRTGQNHSSQDLSISVTPQKGIAGGPDNVYQIGMLPQETLTYERVGLSQSFKSAGIQTANLVVQTVDVVGRLVSGSVSVKQLQSVVGISRLAGQAVSQGAYAVIAFMALISVNLGILNILPIPILDGGHILLLSLEGIRRRDFSLAFKERFIQVGLVFLLALIVYVTYNDVARIVTHHS
jgi:regulator of sigma E protease